MPPGKYDLVVYKYASFDVTLTYKDEHNQPVDLTGYSAKLQARVAKAGGELILDMPLVDGQIILGGTAGTIQLKLTYTETGSITAQSGLYDLLLTDAGGTVTRILEGNMVYKDGVSQ